MTPEVAIYVQKSYAKPCYKTESYDARSWRGVEMLKDVLTREGVEVGYASAASVTQFKVIMVSLIAPLDYYSFIKERETWPKGDYKVLIGGFGVHNIQPLLWAADAFWFGRAEEHIAPLVKALLRGERYAHPSLCWADEFDPDGSWEICQATRPYPHAYKTRELGGKKEIDFQEGSIGCRRRCYFCTFTHQRKTILADETDGSFGGNEVSIHDLLREPDANNWNSYVTFGLDGITQRLRYGVNKKIPDRLFHQWLQRFYLEREGNMRIRLYNIVGYPSETEADVRELVEGVLPVMEEAEAAHPGRRRGFFIHSTPFKPVPATPAGLWPYTLRPRYWVRDVARRMFKDRVYDNPYNVCAVGEHYMKTSSQEEGPTAQILDAIITRTTAADSDTVRALARSTKFWNACTQAKIATVRSVLDLDSIIGEQDLEHVATRYLRTWVDPSELYVDWRESMARHD